MDPSPTVKKLIRRFLTDDQSKSLKRSVNRLNLLYRIVYGSSLQRLALAFGCDKEGQHFYTQHYERHFRPLRRRRLNLLEIGIGGFEEPRAGGASLRMWKAYFPHAKINGIDIYEKTFHEEPRIRTFQGSQVDESFIKRVVEEIGPVDIIIDDGSHLNQHVIQTFQILFPLLRDGGIYVVEDLQTSYWEDVLGTSWGGSTNPHATHTSMTFFKSLIDGLNFQEFTDPSYQPTYFDRNIIEMHFYHNLVFIMKGVNNEGSNTIAERS